MSKGRQVTADRAQGIGLIVIDNPPVNALSRPVRAGILVCLAELKSDPAILAMVVTGSRPRFIAGADIRELSGPLEEAARPSVIHAIETCGKPVVAAIFFPTFGSVTTGRPPACSSNCFSSFSLRA